MMYKQGKFDKCDDNAMWQKHLSIARWLFLAVTLYFIFFSEEILPCLLGVSIYLILTSASVILDWRHAQWHIKNDK